MSRDKLAVPKDGAVPVDVVQTDPPGMETKGKLTVLQDVAEVLRRARELLAKRAAPR